MTIPGTVIPTDSNDEMPGVGFLSGIFAGTSSLVLGQVREITGLDTSALQNWVKRGWVSSPVNRSYNIDQVARILIINMLRESLHLEQIAFLLSYVNGSVYDRTDDIIPESKLYEYICMTVFSYRGKDINDQRALDRCIKKVTGDYVESLAGATIRLREALRSILLAYRSAQVKRKAELFLEQLRD